MEFTTNAEGKQIFNFDESNQNEDGNYGNSLADYEILQFLSQDTDINFVAKVRSLNNNKIYSIKKVDISNYKDQKTRDNITALMNKLKQLNNPHIIKYYHSFEENNNLYLLMEFMNNSDISGYIQAHQILNEKIPEEEIWNILLQCLSALDYLHSQNIGNTGVKLTNILMNNEQNVKIGVFREFNFTQNEFNPREDIYTLGKYFYAMMDSKIIKSDDLKVNNFFTTLNYKKVQNTEYSKSLTDIINSMSKDNKSNVKVEDLYENVKKEYVKKYARNTSIKAILKCLYSYEILNDIIKQKKLLIEKNKQKYYIHYWYSQAIDAISGIREDDLNLCIEEFRRAIASSYSKLDGNKEVDPLLLLTFLLFRLHQESNEVDEDNLANLGKIKVKYVISSSFDGEEEDKTNKEQVWNKFITKYNKKVNSLISDLFFGFVKTKIICQTCRKGFYSFSNYFYIVFDLTKYDSNTNFNIIEDGFKIQYNKIRKIMANDPDKIWCEVCNSYQTFKEFNRYYMLRNHLIICFIRGNNYKNKSKIIFEEEINLEAYIEPKIDSHKKFSLVGCINRTEEGKDEKFISFYREPDNQQYWHCEEYLDYSSQNFSILPIINTSQKKGQIIMLFYNSKDVLDK